MNEPLSSQEQEESRRLIKRWLPVPEVLNVRLHHIDNERTNENPYTFFATRAFGTRVADGAYRRITGLNRGDEQAQTQEA